MKAFNVTELMPVDWRNLSTRELQRAVSRLKRLSIKTEAEYAAVRLRKQWQVKP